MNGTLPEGVDEQSTRHKAPRRALCAAGGFYPPLRLVRAKRFLSGNEPGGSGNQRIGTSPVRHCPAVLPLSKFPVSTARTLPGGLGNYRIRTIFVRN